MASSTTLFLLLTLLCFCPAPIAHARYLHKTSSSIISEIEEALGFADESIPTVLSRNGLPVGLLPSAVQNYTLSDNGEFEVRLDTECYVKFDYDVYYAKVITGKIKYGAITDLSGIQAKQAFIWVSVTGIRVDIPSSGSIYFQVGPISKKLSIDQFEDIPSCRRKSALSSILSDTFAKGL